MGETSRFRGRRWLLAAAIGLAIVVVAWQVLERIADVDRYRPQAEAELARAVGLPVKIGRLDLAWRPIPCLSAIDVSVGEGDLAATATRVDLYPAVHALASRRIEIVRISLRDLAVTLPPDTGRIQSASDQIATSLEQAYSGGDAAQPSDWSVSVSSVVADDAILRLGTDAAPLLVASVTADGVSSEELELELRADFPEIGARTRGSLLLPLGEGGAGGGLRGFIDVTRLQPHRLFELPALLRSTIRARIEIASEKLEELRVDLSGDFEPDEEGAAAGSFSSQTRIGSDATASGALELKSGDFALDADARWTGDTLEIARLDAGPLTLQGRLRPDAERGGVELALSGRVALADSWLHALGAPQTLRDAKGTLVVREISGHFPPEPGATPLSLRAELDGGSLRLAGDGIDDVISQISLRISSVEKQVFVEGSARSQQLGALSTNATLEPEASRARGALSFDAGTLTGYLAEGEPRKRLAPLLQRYGETRVGFRLEPAAGKDGHYALHLERVEAPPARGVLTLRPGAAELVGDIEAEAEIAAEALAGVLPEGARSSGVAVVTLRRDVAKGALTIDADLTRLGLATGDFIEKKPGEPLGLRFAGGSDWSVRTLDVSSGKGALSFAFENGGLVAPDLDLDLADWSHLLVGDARLAGGVSGSIDLPAARAELALSRVSLHFSDDVGVDALDGAVLLRGDDWSVRDLRIRGAQSDATLDASLSKGILDGRLSGANLDLDFVEALVGEVVALLPERTDAEPSPPLSGTLGIRLDRMAYGRSEAKAVNASIRVDDGNVAVRDLALETYEGRISGTIDVRVREDAPSLLELDLAFADVTGRFLDDAFFDPPRDIRGRFAGTLRFEAPLPGDMKAMLSDAGGRFEATGVDGSFGRLGFATKLMTVVRSSETLRAKLPTMRDEGLVFETMAAKLAMKSGKLDVEVFDIDSHSYTIDASGTLDFRKDESRVPIEANLIKGLSGVVSWIPVAGKALEIVNVRLVATGSPYDLQVGIASVKDQLLGAGRAGAGAIIEDASQALRILRGAVGGNGGGTEPKPPEAVAQAPSASPDVPGPTPEAGAPRGGPDPATSDPAPTPGAVEPTPGPAAEEADPAPDAGEPEPGPAVEPAEPKAERETPALPPGPRNDAPTPASEEPDPPRTEEEGGDDAAERPSGEAL